MNYLASFRTTALFERIEKLFDILFELRLAEVVIPLVGLD